jgi:hypothetical protein
MCHYRRKSWFRPAPRTLYTFGITSIFCCRENDESRDYGFLRILAPPRARRTTLWEVGQIGAWQVSEFFTQRYTVLLALTAPPEPLPYPHRLGNAMCGPSLEIFRGPLLPGKTPKNRAPTADQRSCTGRGVRRERLPSFRKASDPVKAQAAPEERRVDLAELSARANAEPGLF